MSTQARDGMDWAVLEQIMADYGVWVAAEEIDAVLRSLGRIQKAAAVLLPSTSFDTTLEQFHRLIESDAEGAGG